MAKVKQLDLYALEVVSRDLSLNVLPETAQHANRMEIPSESKANTMYICSQRKSDGKWMCSCPDWIYRKQKTGGKCKHLMAILSALESTEKELIG